MKFWRRLNDITFGRGMGEVLEEASKSLSDISNRGRIPVGPKVFPQIIGLAGQKHSGKSEVRRILEDKYGFVSIPFAKKLKEALRAVYDLSEAQLYRDEKDTVDDRYGLTPRFIMERFATEVARQVHPQTWVMAWERLLQLENSHGNARFVVDDVRFHNEVKVIKGWGGRVWRVVRPGLGDHGPHKSEQVLPVTILAGEIINDSTLDELEITVEAWMARTFPKGG